MDETERRLALAAFLRTRRARLQPAEVGLPAHRRRRTPGLRREEVADLANIGVSWYTLLEQGQDVHPSREVLASLAQALKLTGAERRHLFLLAHQEVPESVAPFLNRAHALHFKRRGSNDLSCVLLPFVLAPAFPGIAWPPFFASSWAHLLKSWSSASRDPPSAQAPLARRLPCLSSGLYFLVGCRTSPCASRPLE